MRATAPFVVAILLTGGCPGPDAKPVDSGDTKVDSGRDTGEDTAPVDTGDSAADTAPDAGTLDQDGDGYTPNDGDCDDERAHVFPGAPDYCDGLDADCDGEAIPDRSCGQLGDPLAMWTWSFDGCGSYCWVLGVLGDVDGDGLDDAWTRSGLTSKGASELGVLYGASFRNGAPRQTLPDAVWTDNFPQWAYSYTVAGGDTNGDAIQDVWLYTRSDAGYTGAAFLILGREGGFGTDVDVFDDAADAMWVDSADPELRTFVGAGDINGDGFSDAVLATNVGADHSWAMIFGEPTPSGAHAMADLPSVPLGYAENEILGFGMMVADLDGNGSTDMANYTGSLHDDDHVVLFTSGDDVADGAFFSEIASPAWLNYTGATYLNLDVRASSVGAGDINEDGVADLALAHFVNGEADGIDCLGVYSGGIPSGDFSGATVVDLCGLAGEYLGLRGWYPDTDGDGTPDIHVLTDGNRECLVPSTRLHEGGVQMIDDVVGPCTDALVPLTTTADFDGDGRPEWIYNDADWEDPDTYEQVGRTLIVAGFDIPWDDPAKW